MKILWVKSDFLHPTTRGGQIRTLETLKRLHANHEVHYLAYATDEEGPSRAGEYASYVYPIRRAIPTRRSIRFLFQLARSFFSRTPLALSRYMSEEMRAGIEKLRRTQNFDAVVCDFLTPAPNFDALSDCVLFQHNVETLIWRRHAQHAKNALARWYLQRQADLMFEAERRYSQDAGHIVSVSEVDADVMREMFGVTNVTATKTGVDVDYFSWQPADRVADLVFVGSMDWLPNIDGVEYFLEEVLPLIRSDRPDCSVAVVGRAPSQKLRALAESSGVKVTGTVPDVRPYLWGSKVSIVPLRIGGGTRLKIYEAMAAGIPVVSTSIGAEGLDVRHGENILLADEPQSFADSCLTLLEREDERRRFASAGADLISARFSWQTVTNQFESVLAASRLRV
jgi:glycosyltransferase involved in cell wall biosynthesis